MTRRILLMTLCALITNCQLLIASPCRSSWLSTPTCPPVTACTYLDQPCNVSSIQCATAACEYGCNNRCGLDAGFDFLYWTACQDHLDFAVDHATAEDPPTLLGHTLALKF